MSLAGTLGLSSYRVAGYLAGPVVRRKLRQRMALGKEDPQRIGERLGHTRADRPSGTLVWVHAASVGEGLAALLLIDEIHKRHTALRFLLTTSTVTSANLLASQLPPFVIHQFAPVDLPMVARRFLDHWQPDAALLLESEFWPNLLLGLAHRAIPAALVNGRVSPDSYARWSALRPVIADLLACFEVCLGQSDRDAEYLRALGALHVVATGNIKDASPPLGVDKTTLDAVQAAVGDRPRWIAASTHAGEEVVVAETHHALLHRFPNLLTIIVPRHPERGAEVCRTLDARGTTAALRSRGEEIGRDTTVYIADTLGEMGLWYRLCPIAFIGKSLIGRGGQNPLEPARLGCALLMGPHMSNFQQISTDLVSCGAARLVDDAADLQSQLGALLGDDEVRLAMIRAGQTYSAAGGMAMTATMTHLESILSRVGNGIALARK
ncbi:MAG: 3-deoxy-D-manno-octulosonic acid transferase [Alphaproteobacteria bacterium]